MRVPTGSSLALPSVLNGKMGDWEKQMRKLITAFGQQEDGAVTVDWVVITAAITGLAVVVIAGIQSAATDTSAGIGVYISDRVDALN